MGHRANFVVIRNGEAKAYYDNWAAVGCIFSFAAGPDEACEAVSHYEPTNELMDWAFAEGGYLIDFDEKKRLSLDARLTWANSQNWTKAPTRHSAIRRRRPRPH